MLPLLLAATLATPDIFVISVDTLRADYLGCYGHPYNTSPNLDRLAEKSLVFDDMICEVPLTGPSFCAMMSSRYPRVTGATRNGLRLPERFSTVAEQFRAAGYETVCVQSNWTLKAKLSGLDRGFDVYDDAFHEKRWGVLKGERSAEEVTRIALDLIDARDIDKPLFAWFHYSDPHAPYVLHRKFNVARSVEGKTRKIRKVRARYNSEIALTDSFIAQLLEAIPESNAFVVFVGDHGESLYEHDYLGHGRRTYQATLRIPFMIRGPGVAPGRSAAPARGIDVGTTLLDLAGLAPPPDMSGLALLRDTPAANRVRVVETYGGAVPNLPGAKAMMANRGPQRQASLVDGWKLIRNGSKHELFNLTVDPMEERDLAEQEPGIVVRLGDLITEWDAETDRGASDAADLDQDDKEALDALGYTD